MELEKEINQSKFQSQYQKLGINIIYTASWLRNFTLQRLKPYNISPEQFNILRILRGRYPKPSTIMLLTERMLDKSSNASRIVEKLRQKGYVERKECSKDRRQVDILITDAGREVLAKLDESEDDWYQIMGGLTEEEAKLVNNLLDKLRG
ncbi:MarR family transcriptional regulator [Cytophagaceae bacterium ABcell3]|nr:MarR family transcriptional regulator [Cytophagaceae bacterium ABcell3]